MDANRGYIFLSSNYQNPEYGRLAYKLFKRATLIAGSTKLDMGTLLKEKEKFTVHPYMKGCKTLFT